MNSSSVMIVNLSLSELEEIIQKAVSEGLGTFNKNPKELNETGQLITRIQAADFLNISLPTLTKYVKQGKIPAHRIGSRILFQKNEILNSLKEVQVRNLYY
jgi:excisionase family DNA binding protein